MDDKDFYQASQVLPEDDLAKAHRHLHYWQIVTIICLIVLLIQCILIGYLMTVQHEYVYVAKVNSGDKVEDIISLSENITADGTQKMIFINNYINNLLSLSLDPVLIRNNWMNNYKFSSNQAKQDLSKFISKENLLDKVGKQTQKVNIVNFNSLSDNSYQFTWDVISYNQAGKKQEKNSWSGVFTLSQMTGKRTGVRELANPYGLQVESFSMDKLGD